MCAPGSRRETPVGLHSCRNRSPKRGVRVGLSLLALTAAATTATAVSGAAAIEKDSARPHLALPAHFSVAIAPPAQPAPAVEIAAPAATAQPVQAVAPAPAKHVPPVSAAPVGATAGAKAPRVRAIMGLGDSVMVGTGCRCPDFIRLLGQAQAAAQGSDVDFRNASQNGLTSAGLVEALRDPNVAAGTKFSDVVVVTIGANDFDSGQLDDAACGPKTSIACYQADLRALRTNLTDVLARIRQLHRSGIRILVTGYWNVFLDGDVGRGQGAAYVASSDALTRAANAVIRDAARKGRAQYVDLYAPFKGGGDTDDTALLAPDGDHPSAAGHRLIAGILRRALAQG